MGTAWAPHVHGVCTACASHLHLLPQLCLKCVVATAGVREHFLTGSKGGKVADEGELTVAFRRLIVQLHARGAAVDAVQPVDVLKAVSRRHNRCVQRKPTLALALTRALTPILTRTPNRNSNPNPNPSPSHSPNPNPDPNLNPNLNQVRAAQGARRARGA